MSDYAIMSSGDAEKDQRDLARFLRSDARIRSGMCPNGCGGMVEVDTHNAECIKCGFTCFRSSGLNFEPPKASA